MTENMAKEEALKELLQLTGDGIANMFDQLTKGNWTDDHGHPVANNIHMLNMNKVLVAIMEFRHQHLGYTDPTLRYTTEYLNDRQE